MEESSERNQAKIGKNSNNNTILQNCNVQNINLFPTESIIPYLGKARDYESLQDYVSHLLATTAQQHPLFPDYTATWDSSINRLISTPQTEEALRRYPKTIKGKLNYNSADYPGFNSEKESIWEYGYRTQSSLSFNAQEYQEYIGDIEDPFPVIPFRDGLQLSMVPPPFPAAIEASLISKEQRYLTSIKRVPCLEYGKVVMQNPDSDCLGITIIFDTEASKYTITFSRRNETSIEKLIERERILASFVKNKEFQIINGGIKLIDWSTKGDAFEAQFFKSATAYLPYYNVLHDIEKQFGCSFSMPIQQIEPEDILCARLFYNYIHEPNNWHHEKLDFDDDIRVSYDNIPDFLHPDNDNPIPPFKATGQRTIVFHGVKFRIDEFSVFYDNVKINNKASMRKAIKKRRKSFPITFRPAVGTQFNKYYKFVDVKLIKPDE